MLVGLLWGGPSFAATPVVYDDRTDAVDHAAARLGADAATFEPVSLDTLRATPPSLASGAPVVRCEEPGPLGATAFEDRLRKAEGALLYGDFPAATARLAEARSAAVCGPPVAAARLARLELVAGLVHEEAGRPDEALARYRAALAYDPGLAWHEAYPADRRGRFDEAAGALDRRPVALTVLPGAAVTVDGRPLGAGDVVPGEHVVRVGSVAVRVTLDALPNRLLVPGAFADDALAGMSDPAGQAALTALFAAGLGEAREMVVVHGDDVWTGLSGRSDFTRHGAAPVPDPVPDPVPAPVPGPVPAPVPVRASRGAPIGLLVGSVLVGAVGGVVGVVEQERANREAASATTYTGWPSHEAAYRAARRNAWIGYGGLVAGGVGAGVGLVWTIAR